MVSQGGGLGRNWDILRLRPSEMGVDSDATGDLEGLRPSEMEKYSDANEDLEGLHPSEMRKYSDAIRDLEGLRPSGRRSVEPSAGRLGHNGMFCADQTQFQGEGLGQMMRLGPI